MGTPFYKKATVQATIVGGVFLLLSVILTAYLTKNNKIPEFDHKTRVIEAEDKKTPIINQLPREEINTKSETKIIPGDDRLHLRTKNGVRELTPSESNFNISKAPRGVYGFARPVDIMFQDSVKLSRNPDIEDFEIHKLIDGSVYVIGFVGKDTAIQLGLDNPLKNFKLTLYSDKWVDGSNIIELPLSEIITSDVPRYIELDGGIGLFALDIQLK